MNNMKQLVKNREKILSDMRAASADGVNSARDIQPIFNSNLGIASPRDIGLQKYPTNISLHTARVDSDADGLLK